VSNGNSERSATVVLASVTQDESRQQQLTELLGILSTGRVLRDQISVFVALAFIYRFVKRNACPLLRPHCTRAHTCTRMHLTRSTERRGAAVNGDCQRPAMQCVRISKGSHALRTTAALFGPLPGRARAACLADGMVRADGEASAPHAAAQSNGG
jgi:hypothetical protein